MMTPGRLLAAVVVLAALGCATDEEPRSPAPSTSRSGAPNRAAEGVTDEDTTYSEGRASPESQSVRYESDAEKTDRNQAERDEALREQPRWDGGGFEDELGETPSREPTTGGQAEPFPGSSLSPLPISDDLSRRSSERILGPDESEADLEGRTKAVIEERPVQ